MNSHLATEVAPGLQARRHNGLHRCMMPSMDSLLASMKNVEHRDIHGVAVDVATTGSVRMKRMIYPVGFHWTKDLAEELGHEYCPHAHVGFMAQGQINVEFEDGCVEEFRAPQFVCVEPGHKGWVVGDEAAVLIEVDFGKDTVQQLSVPTPHKEGTCGND